MSTHSLQLTNCLIDDPEKSKSKSNVSVDGLDSLYAQGGYINDDFSLGNYKLPKLRMGVAQATDFFAGRLGLGTYNLNQDDAPTMQNSTILDSMVANGLIKRRAYSLWLNTIDADKGSIIFGGVDTEKFEGELKWINISATVPAYVFMVRMSYTLGETTIASEGMVNPDGEQVASTTTATGEASAIANPTDSDANDPADVLAEALRFLAMFVTFDATSYVSMIPLSLFDPLAELFGAVQIGDSPLQTVPCSLPKEGSISFQFDNLENGPIIKIPFSELAFPIPDWMQPGSGPLTFEDEEQETAACGFGLTPFDTEGMMVLGQTFMRSAYIVFDHDDMTVGLANVRWNVTESNIVEFNTEGLLDSALTTSASSVSATASVADDQATGTMSVSATNVGTQSSDASASESTATTASTASGDHTFTQTSTDSALSSNTSFVSAALAVDEGSVLHLLIFALCGSIFLIAAMSF